MARVEWSGGLAPADCLATVVRFEQFSVGASAEASAAQLCHVSSGAYSVRRRARWRRAGILTDARPSAAVIHAILRHLRRTGRDPRALPEHDARFASRAPP
jgi:hypothetical protein